MSATDSADSKKRTSATVGAVDAKKAKHEESAAVQKEVGAAPLKDGNITLQKDRVGVGIAGTAGGLYARGLSGLEVPDDPHGQFLVMITSNTEKAERRRMDKSSDCYVIDCVIIRAIKSGFSTSPYEVGVRNCIPLSIHINGGHVFDCD